MKLWTIDDVKWKSREVAGGKSGSRRVEPQSDQADQATPIRELASEEQYFAVF